MENTKIVVEGAVDTYSPSTTVPATNTQTVTSTSPTNSTSVQPLDRDGLNVHFAVVPGHISR